MATIIIEDYDGTRSEVYLDAKSPDNLMEIIKASGYDILATCGGMGLCATCHVKVVKGLNHLPPAGQYELQTLDTLYNAEPDSRLACQIETPYIPDGAIFKINQDDY